MFENIFKIKITGVSTNIKILIGLAYFNAISSACIDATVFGTISPNIIINKVSIPTPTLINMSLKRLCVKIVAIDEAAIFTMLFPISTVLSIFLELFSTLFKTIAFLFSSSTRVLSLILLTVVKAVSADEKNAENKSNTTNTHSNAMSLGPI